jgi:hypothetical protein
MNTCPVCGKPDTEMCIETATICPRKRIIPQSIGTEIIRYTNPDGTILVTYEAICLDKRIQWSEILVP